MNQERLLAHRLRNNLQSAGLVLVLASLLVSLAWLIGGEPFAWGALFAVALLYLINPVASPRLVMSLYHARPIAYGEAAGLYQIVEELSRRAGLQRLPKLYYLPTRVMNAFTSGSRNAAAIAVSDGLLRAMSPREVAGVLAHEVSHLANGDTRVMSFADLVSRVTGTLSLAGKITLLASLPLWLLTETDVPWLLILVLLVAPTLSSLIQLALSRSREYEADRTAAELSGDPDGLAAALLKLERGQGRIWARSMLPGYRIPEPSPLRTHPPTGERVRRLRELREREFLPLPVAGPARGTPFGGIRVLDQGLPLPPRRHFGGLWY
jgi:heat shock protein HtpX